MKKIFLSALIIFIIFIFVGLFFSKNNSNQKNLKNSAPPSFQNQSSGNNTSTFEGDNSILSLNIELQRKLNEEIAKLKEKVSIDKEKSLSSYFQEIKNIQDKFSTKIKDQKEIPSEFFIDLAQDLSLIKPPAILYEFHLELLKIYYSIGFALKEAERTNNETQKIFLYNYVRGEMNRLIKIFR